MNYFIPGVGHVTGAFKDAEGRSYPRNWLALATQEQLDALGAISQPVYDKATQKIIKTAEGFDVVDKTQEELDKEDVARITNRVNAFKIEVQEKIDALLPPNEWQQMVSIALDPATPIEIQDNIHLTLKWFCGCWDEYDAKLPDVQDGKPVIFDPTPPPYTLKAAKAALAK